MKTSISVLLLTIVAFSACGRKSSDAQNANNSVSQTVNASLTNLGGAADDASGAAVSAVIELPKKSAIEIALEEAFLPKTAWAAAYCDRSLQASAGTCVRNVNCSVGPYSWSGSVVLTFSNGTNCLAPSLGTPGDYFTRQANFTRSAFAYTVETISTPHENYLGESISGGSKVTRAASGDLTVEILGVSKVLSTPSATIADMSFKTSTPVDMNHLARAGRVIHSGAVTIYHNRLKYTAVHSYKEITWGDIDCPYPTSGEIDITFSGNESGSAKVTFNGCGSYSLTRDGDTSNNSMDASE